MRSPERKGTVPSFAMSTPSNDIRIVPCRSTALAGLVGSARRMYTPFWPACYGGAGRHRRLSHYDMDNNTVPLCIMVYGWKDRISTISVY